MKRTLFVLICFCAICVTSAYAHPPRDIKISYDPSTKMLRAVIEHGTSNPSAHYIKKVDISLNGKEILQQEISRQDDGSSQHVVYFIPDAKVGDEISVEGYCSIGGKLKKRITVQ